MIKLIFLTFHLWSGEASTPTDSLRLEVIDGKSFIIHQVDAQETLFGISRRYKVTIAQLLEYNREADAGLEIGQLLKVPYIPKNPVAHAGDYHTVAAGETLFSISRLYNLSVEQLKALNGLTGGGLAVGQQLKIKGAQAAPEVKPAVQGVSVIGFHAVKAQETLYGIARGYGITIQQLKEWNNLTGSNLEVGQLLRVASPDVLPSSDPVRDTVKKIAGPVVKVTEPIVISENVAGANEVKESGLAELIDGTDGNRKYLALHRSAKVGTILKVRNELNNREVFVRVVGPLPSTGVNDKLIIKISKSAFDRLGGIDARFRVELTYYN